MSQWSQLTTYHIGPIYHRTISLESICQLSRINDDGKKIRYCLRYRVPYPLHSSETSMRDVWQTWKCCCHRCMTRQFSYQRCVSQCFFESTVKLFKFSSYMSHLPLKIVFLIHLTRVSPYTMSRVYQSWYFDALVLDTQWDSFRLQPLDRSNNNFCNTLWKDVSVYARSSRSYQLRWNAPILTSHHTSGYPSPASSYTHVTRCVFRNHPHFGYQPRSHVASWSSLKLGQSMYLFY